ncbi:hypothetical protein Poli38472_010680 [Pythium oligandrum]|uniref:Tudor domain-containing protein n=1 Tax=Pythium oligandrum TaxID=41045 RepID=A0A8K1CGA0_PYTOL|nr:hypothetical protein Poli38472_010680 [Pythium oligandrum]|eukprot:TMW61617.1 hypothetical protein Poli38472_010680 [Pythium oligandrum]
MASDGDGGKKRSSSPNVAKDSSGREKEAKRDGNDGQSSSGFAVGDRVRVQGTSDKSKKLEATVTRKHMSGEYTVEYVESGKTEKYVKAERLERSKESSEKVSGFAEGDSVLYRRKSTGSEAETAWRDGVVKACRSDDSFDMVDVDTEEVVRKVSSTNLKKKKAKKTKKEDEKGDDKEASWSVDDRVEFKNEDGEWIQGRISKRRNDGTYDVVHESDEDLIERKLASRQICARKSTKKKQTKKSESEHESEESVRKRKPSKRKEGSEDDEEDDDSTDRPRKRRPNQRRGGNGRARLQFPQLRLHQLIDFEDDGGKWHRGRIKLLRKDEETCDIEHESDTETISKRVSVVALRPVSVLARVWGNRAADPNAYQLNARVFYRTKEGDERKGFVIKAWRDKGAVTYDIEDEIEGDVIKRVPGSKLRPVPWININYSLPTLPSLPPLPSLPAWNFGSFMPSTILRKGMNVRVRRRMSATGRIQWEDGVIVRTKSDATCIVELRGPDGEVRDKIQVKNADIRPKFTSPFTGMLDGLQLPTLQLPRGLYPPKSAVEVSDGSNVYMGTVVTVNEAERLYTILYNDGRKEKNVPADRVRLSLRRLRIGTEVEMIVEGPCKEVSQLDGEVAWVHRDEKVAVRINGGNNDVFAEVCTHALMVDGQPAFSAPLSSTWFELCGFYLNLSLEAFSFIWFVFGMTVELGEMIRVLNETSPTRLEDASVMDAMYTQRNVNWTECARQPSNGASSLLIPAAFLSIDRSWLMAMIIIKAVLVVCCAGFAFRLVHSKIMAIQDNFIDLKEYQQDRVLRRYFHRVMGVTLLVAYLALLVYAALLNRFESYCLVQPVEEMRFDQLALHVDMFAVHTHYPTTVDLLLGLTAKSVFNLFRATALYVLVFTFPGGFLRRVLCVAPSVALTALMSAMGIASLHIFYYVHRTELLDDGITTLSTQVDYAVVLVFVSIWFNSSLNRLLTATGNYFETISERHANARGDLTDDILDQAERGEFGLQAKHEALMARVELRQEQLGICKLSVLRIQRQFLIHIVLMIVGICVNEALRQDVPSDDSTAHAAFTLHLVVCIVWLVQSILTSLYALVVKREAPELLTYILDM